MPSTYSQNLRIELLASGEQGNTWGNSTNNNLGTLIEQAISGFRSLSTGWSSNAITLTAFNGANDQARNMYLEVPSSVSLSAEGEIIAPTVPKMYVIKNVSSGGFAVRIKTGTSATTCLIPNGQTKVVVCDGTEFSEAVTGAASFSITNAPASGANATNKTYVDTADNLRLKRDGSENMTGELILSSGGTPSNSLAAVSKQYVTTTYLPLAGGTMTGALTLASATPTGNQAVSRNYLDGLSITSANTGITIGGSVSSRAVSLTLNPATAASLGGVKQGSGISIAGDGTISASGSAGVTTATGISPVTVNGASGVAATGPVNISVDLSAYATTASLSSASVNYANSAGSASTAGSATTATTATYINGGATYSFSTPTYNNSTASSTGALFRTALNGGTPITAVNSNNNASLGASIVLVRTNTTNTGNPSGEATFTAFYYGTGIVSGAGIVSVSSGTQINYATGSDYRLKQNIVPVANALTKVEALNPISFEFKANPGTSVDGFIAHEVADIVPNAVNGAKDAIDEEGKPIYQGIDHSKLIPILVAAIQELKAEIDALKGA